MFTSKHYLVCTIVSSTYKVDVQKLFLYFKKNYEKKNYKNQNCDIKCFTYANYLLNKKIERLKKKILTTTFIVQKVFCWEIHSRSSKSTLHFTLHCILSLRTTTTRTIAKSPPYKLHYPIGQL
jgi:hypothetical protein